MSALSSCVGNVEAFKLSHWGRKFLLHHGDQGFDHLLSLDDVDQLVSGAGLRWPSLRMVKAGTTIYPETYTRNERIGPETMSGLIEAPAVGELFHDGSTIVLQGVQHFWGPVSAFCRELELEITHPVSGNVYITPTSSQGLDVHYDLHDVFVLQLSGRKNWRLYERASVDSISEENAINLGELGRPELEAVLAPGDCLYIPRGVPHAALSRDEVSAHLTIGLLAYTWLDLFGALFETLDEEPAFSESLPLSFARDGIDNEEWTSRVEHVLHMLRTTGADEPVHGLARVFWSTRKPLLLGGELRRVMNIDAINGSSEVRRRPGAFCRIEPIEGSDEIRVLLGDRELTMPSQLGSSMELLASGRVVALAELRDLDESDRMILCRQLIIEGLLEVVGTQPGGPVGPGAE